MTRKFNASDTQTGFSGWLRNNPNLDSVREGISVLDSDLWIHKFKHRQQRDHQFLMLIEVKERGADMSDAQRDTLHIVNQLLRNRRNTRTEWHARDIDGAPRISDCHSLQSKREIQVLCYGAHCLRIMGDGTFCHWQKLLWDSKEISVEQLEKLLRFEIDPDNFNPIDHRPDSRHKTTQIVSEEQTPIGFTVDKILTNRS